MTDLHMAPGGGNLTQISELEKYLEPFHIKTLPTQDGWGNKYSYQSGPIGPNQDLYSIISYGRGGVFDGIDTNESPYTVTTMEDFNKDICFSNGVFTYAPKQK